MDLIYGTLKARRKKAVEGNDSRDREETKNLPAVLLPLLVNGLKQMTIAQPLDPFLWFGDFLLSQKGKVRPLADKLHMNEKIRAKIERNIELIETKYRAMRKSVIRIHELEKEILDESEKSSLLPEDEKAVTGEDAHFHSNAERGAKLQEDTPPASKVVDCRQCPTQEDVGILLGSTRKLNEYANPRTAIENFLPVLKEAIQALEKAYSSPTPSLPEDPVDWLIPYLHQKSPWVQLSPHVEVAYTKEEAILRAELHWSQKQLDGLQDVELRINAVREDLEEQYEERRRLAEELKRQGKRLDPRQWTRGQRIASEKLERKLMASEEAATRKYLRDLLERKSAIIIQAQWRGYKPRKAYLLLQEKRRKAATIIQAHTKRYLLQRRTTLPGWFDVGIEVVISDRELAKRLATKFEFYQSKDSPGNDFKLVEGKNVNQLKKICLLDDSAAGFNTSGWLKSKILWKPQWISLGIAAQPISRKSDTFTAGALSKAPPTASLPLSTSASSVPAATKATEPKKKKGNPPAVIPESERGLYVKVVPDEVEIIVTGIIASLPKNTFGDVSVVLDGRTDEVSVNVNVLERLWLEQYDWDSGYWYYVNTRTQLTTWNAPKIYRDRYERGIEAKKRVEIFNVVVAKRKVEKEALYAARIQAAWKGKKQREKIIKAIILEQKRKKQDEEIALAGRKATSKVNSPEKKSFFGGFGSMLKRKGDSNAKN